MGQQILQGRMNALATKLITKFGPTDGVNLIRQQSPSDYNPLDGSSTPNAAEETNVDAAPPVPVEERMVRDNSAVLEGDFVTYVASSAYLFQLGDINSLKLVYPDRAGSYTLVHFKEWVAGTDAAMTELFVRRV